MEKTALYNFHKNSGAKFVPFAGYEMPIQYKEGIVKEHISTRQSAGFFDVSHMGQLYISGNNSIAFMSSIPLGILHNIMFLSTISSTKSRINSTNNRVHYYNLQWSSIYDQYSINLGLHHYFTESRSSISNESNFVNGISITFIYNY